MNSGGSGDWRSRGRREAMPKPVSRTARCRVDEDIGWLDVLMDEPASVELTECAGQGHCESEKLSDLHRLADEAIERLASCVVDNQHGLPAFAHELQWPQCPRAVQVLSKFVFVCEAIDALERRVLSAGKDGYESVPDRRQHRPAVVCRRHGRRLATTPLASRLPNQPRTRRMPSSASSLSPRSSLFRGRPASRLQRFAQHASQRRMLQVPVWAPSPG